MKQACPILRAVVGALVMLVGPSVPQASAQERILADGYIVVVPPASHFRNWVREPDGGLMFRDEAVLSGTFCGSTTRVEDVPDLTFYPAPETVLSLPFVEGSDKPTSLTLRLATAVGKRALLSASQMGQLNERQRQQKPWAIRAQVTIRVGRLRPDVCCDHAQYFVDVIEVASAPSRVRAGANVTCGPHSAEVAP